MEAIDLYVYDDYTNAIGNTELHLYQVKFINAMNNTVTISPNPLCSHTDVTPSKTTFPYSRAYDEDAMAVLCAKQKRVDRHCICADCVKHFYKSDN